MRSAAGYGSERSSTASTTLKIAVHAPMPSASESTAAAVKPGRVRNMRAAYLKSCHNRFIAEASSFVSQSDHRIDFGGAARGQITGQQRNRKQRGGDTAIDHRVDRRHLGQDACENAIDEQRSDDADDNTDRGQANTLADHQPQ